MDFSARAELRLGLNPSPCNRQFGFQRICYRSRAEISARDEVCHVIRPSVRQYRAQYSTQVGSSNERLELFLSRCGLFNVMRYV